MSEISIDQAKCNGCKLCMQVCTLGNFEVGGDGKVHPAPGMMCFSCGHCIAVCPTEAMTHVNLPNERFSPAENPVAYDQFIKLLQGRRSRREFNKEPVSDDDIEKILQAAVCGPSSINNQSVEFTVITNTETIAKIATGSIACFVKMAKFMRGIGGKLLVRSMARGIYDEILKLLPLVDMVEVADTDMVLYDAPCVIFLHAPKSDIYAGADYGYASENILLAAESLGLGACVIGLATDPMNRDKKLKALAGIPPNHKVFDSIVVGHPRFRYKRTVPKLAPKAHYVK